MSRRRVATMAPLLFASLLAHVVGAVGPVGGEAAEVAARRPARIAPAPGKPMPSPGGPRPAGAGTRSDPAVTQAGGGHANHCGHCRRHACPQCRLPDAGIGHGPCQHGLCPAHCPVRPDVFGFYGTQWRKWPGSGVIKVSNQDEATPVRPPKAEVPEAAEEALQSPTGDEPLPAPAAGDAGNETMDEGGNEPPADDRKGAAEPPRLPLPRPFPAVDEGASDGRRAGRRVSRRIFLDEQPPSGFVARLVNNTAADAREASDDGVARAGGDGAAAESADDVALESTAEPATAPEPRSSTAWRLFLAAGDEDDEDDAATGP